MGIETTDKNAAVLKTRAIQGTRELIGFAERRLGIRIPTPPIDFDLRGKAAGQVRTTDGRSCRVRYNLALLVRNPEDFLSATVPHETAHVVAFRLYGLRVRPHGREWQSIMLLFGAEPRRCHDYDINDLQTRHLNRYRYRCGCSSHDITSIRHNRILDGQIYLCRRCGGPLQRAPAAENDPGT